MKNLFILTAILFSTAVYSGVYAQGETPPPVTGDKNLRDTDIKTRSIDLERVERDAKKPSKTTENQNEKAEDKLASKYDEIKTDFEQIQLSQDAIIKTYQTSVEIDYEKIGKSAAEIHKSAKRLDENLFSGMKKEKTREDTKEKPTVTVRNLIIDLDNAIGSFATSPMFQNLREIDAKVAEKAREDLEKIIELSDLLDAEAKKMQQAQK